MKSSSSFRLLHSICKHFFKLLKVILLKVTNKKSLDEESVCQFLSTNTIFSEGKHNCAILKSSSFQRVRLTPFRVPSSSVSTSIIYTQNFLLHRVYDTFTLLLKRKSKLSLDETMSLVSFLSKSYRNVPSLYKFLTVHPVHDTSSLLSKSTENKLLDECSKSSSTSFR